MRLEPGLYVVFTGVVPDISQQPNGAVLAVCY